MCRASRFLQREYVNGQCVSDDAQHYENRWKDQMEHFPDVLSHSVIRRTNIKRWKYEVEQSVRHPLASFKTINIDWYPESNWVIGVYHTFGKRARVLFAIEFISRPINKRMSASAEKNKKGLDRTVCKKRYILLSGRSNPKLCPVRIWNQFYRSHLEFRTIASTAIVYSMLLQLICVRVFPRTAFWNERKSNILWLVSSYLYACVLKRKDQQLLDVKEWDRTGRTVLQVDAELSRSCY